MKCLPKCVLAGLAVIVLAGTAAVQEPIEKELAKVKLELTTTQKMLADLKDALKKSELDQAAAQAKVIEITKIEESLRKELEAEKAAHKQAVAKANAAIKQAQAAQAAAQTKLDDAVKMGDVLRKKLESENALLKTTAAELELAAKEATKAKTDLAAVQAQTAAKLQKAQTDLAASQKTLSETALALSKNQADLADAVKTRELLAKEIAAEKANLRAAAAELDLASKEAARVKADLVAAQKTLTAANLARAQLEQEAQKSLAIANNVADGLRKGLNAEKAQNKSIVAKLEAIALEADRAKSELAAAQKVLAKQPPVPVTVVVTLPADAQLMFGDHRTNSIGSRRVFVSPGVAVGPTFYYALTAEVTRDGKLIKMEKQIEVQAGDRIEVNLTLPEVAAQPPATETPLMPPEKK